jgi:hypothetical protein
MLRLRIYQDRIRQRFSIESDNIYDRHIVQFDDFILNNDQDVHVRQCLRRQQNTNHIRHLHLERYIRLRSYRFHRLPMLSVIVFRNAIVVLNIDRHNIITRRVSIEFVYLRHTSIPMFSLLVRHRFDTCIHLNKKKSITHIIQRSNCAIDEQQLAFVRFCCLEDS